jgi:hypothetical protein
MDTLRKVSMQSGQDQQVPSRIGSRKDFDCATRVWTEQRNQAGICADWRFTTADARIKLKRLYPHIQV